MCEDGPDTSEPAAIAAIKEGRIQPGDVIVLICRGPMGSGMEERYLITSALKHLSYGKHVAVITDARFSGVSTGAELVLYRWRHWPLRAGLAPDPALPEDTRLWALLQELSGGTWGGCVYDAEVVRKAVLAGRGLAG